MKFRIKQPDEAKLVEVKLADRCVQVYIDGRIVFTVVCDGEVYVDKETFASLGDRRFPPLGSSQYGEMG